MLEDIRCRQMKYAPALVGCFLVAGMGTAFIWKSWFLPWWVRALVALVVIGCLAGGGQALGPLREAYQELVKLKRFARANRRGPSAAPLQTPNARRDDDDGMGGADIFEGR